MSMAEHQALYLHIGCGKVKLPGFINIDREGDPDLRLDVREGLPFAPDTVQGIFSEHFIEHLDQGELLAFLRDCRRVLADKGILRLATPDLDVLVREYADGSWREQAWLRQYGYEWIRTPAEYLNVCMREWGHKWVMNPEELTRLLRLAGFDDIQARPLQESADPRLCGLETRDRSFVLEARKHTHPIAEDALVSIVIPAYRPDYFEDCLRSALAQTYPNIEILVLDDSGGEAVRHITETVSKRDGRIRYIRNATALGEPANLTQGIRMAKGALIKPLYDDDLLLPDAVARLVAALRAHPGASLAVCRRLPIDTDGRPVSVNLPQPPAALQGLDVIRGEWVIGSIAAMGANWLGEPTAMLFRRRDALAIDEPDVMSLFGRLCFGIGDVCLAMHLLGRGDLAYVAQPMTQFRLHPGQTQRQPGFRARALDTWAYFRQHAARLGFSLPTAPGSRDEAARPASQPADPARLPGASEAMAAATADLRLTRIDSLQTFVAQHLPASESILLAGEVAAGLLPVLKARQPQPWVGVVQRPEAGHLPLLAEADSATRLWLTRPDELPGSDYDAIVCAGYLETCPAPDKALAAMLTKISPEGQAIFAFRNAASFEVLDRLSRGLSALDGAEAERLYAAESIQRLLETSGWRIETWYGVPSPQFLRAEAEEARYIQRLATDRVSVEVESDAHRRILESATLVVTARPATARAVVHTDPHELYALWLATHTPQGWVLDWMRARMAQFARPPQFHLGIIAEDARINALIPTLVNMGEQLWEHWRISIVARQPCPQPIEGLHPVVQWHRVEPTDDAVAALDRIFHASEADFVGQMEAGDKLALHALFAFADKFDLHPEWQAAYCDEDSLNERGERQQPHFKADFDIDALRAAPFSVGGLWIMRSGAYRALGGYDAVPAGFETYALQLRTWERYGDQGIGHIADVLYHRDAAGGHALLEADALLAARVDVVRGHLERLGLEAEIAPADLPGVLRLAYRWPQKPLVSVCIPTRDRLDLLRRCIESLLKHTAYPNYEIVVVDNGSRDEAVFAYYDVLAGRLGERFRLLRYDAPFNYAAMMNLAAEHARGEFLLHMNNDIAVLDGHWLDQMMAHALRPDVGVVGARLLYPDGRIQHAGLVLGMNNLAAEHPYIGETGETLGHYGRLRYAHAVSAVTGACLLIRRDLYSSLGGMDAEGLQINFNDVDLCLKARARGLKVVWTPHAVLMHEVNASRAKVENAAEAKELGEELVRANQVMFARWGKLLGHDPAYNRNLSLRHERAFQIEIAPALTWDPEWRPHPRVLAHPADRQGCGEYRIIAPMRVLNRSGRIMGWETGSYLGPAELARMQPEVIVLQRQVTDEQIRLIQRYREYSQAFRVYEIDDLITNVPIKSPVKRKFVEQKDLYKRFRKAVRLCDRFVVSTEYLAEEYRPLGPPVVVVQNHLEGTVWLDLPAPKRREGKPRVGWAGAGQHHGDLAILTEVIKATANEVDWVFLGMCLDEARPYVKEFHPGVPLEEYPAKLASLDLDLAVAPLEDVPFNHAKSHLRLLEYGILGYPVVCTDITPYRGGYPVTRVPNRFQAWREAILERVSDRDALRAEGERLRDYIRREWILEDHTDRWLKAWLPD